MSTRTTTTPASEVVIWCREQPWWELIQPLIAQGMYVELHIPTALPDRLIPAARLENGLRVLVVQVTKPKPGLLVILECGRLHFLVEDHGALVNVAGSMEAAVEAVIRDIVSRGDPDAEEDESVDVDSTGPDADWN